MGTLEIAYKILYSLEHKDKPEYMGQIIGPEQLGVEQNQWLDVMKELLEGGYITGVSIRENIIGEINVDITKARITIAGAEYLRDNSAFAKFRNVATDVIRIAADTARLAK